MAHLKMDKVCVGTALAEPRDPETSERVGATFRRLEFGQDRVQSTPQDVGLAERLAASGAEWAQIETSGLNFI